QVIEAALRATRLSEDDLNTAARQAGFAAVGETGAIIIESNGKISVLGAPDVDPLRGVAQPQGGSGDRSRR
ncbi:MAG: YetF domain-containing protein, partial [Shimia sp.]